MKNKSKEDNLKGLYFLLATVFTVWLISIYFLEWRIDDTTIRGTFGDSFGGVNSLFSGLALGGIIYTIFLQKKELSLQREELKETREEFKIQNETLRLQRFENTFFNLLTLHHQIVDSIDLDIEKEKNKSGKSPIQLMSKRSEYERVVLRGRDVFKEKYGSLIEVLNKNSTDFSSSYLRVYEDVQTDFGHYFRNLYRIIKLIDETEFHTMKEIFKPEFDNQSQDCANYLGANYNARYKYTSMVRAQLSDYELLWLFYNCLSTNGIESFKPYIETYSLLKNLPIDKLHNSEVVEKYDKKAFSNK